METRKFARVSILPCELAENYFIFYFGKKNPGIELLSHTLLCSTIVVRPLIDRVRDGNVSFKPAIDTGKKYIRKKEEKRGEEECCKYNVCCLIC